MYKTCLLSAALMFKALDLTMNSLGSGSVMGKKGKKRGFIFSSFSPDAEPGPRLNH